MAYQQGSQAVRKGRMARELHLKGEALALVDTHRTCLSDRQTKPLPWQVLLVTPVSCLVYDPHQRAQEIRLVIARRQAHILRHAAAERVRTFVESARGEVETDELHRLDTQGALRGFWKGPLRHDDTTLLLSPQYLLQQLRQPRFQISEEPIDIGAARTRLIEIEQCLVGRAVRAGGQAPCLFTREPHDLAQVV